MRGIVALPDQLFTVRDARARNTGIEKRTLFTKLTDAPRRPTVKLAPRLPRFIRTPGAIFTDLRKRNPMTYRL